jgi:putative hemolysin
MSETLWLGLAAAALIGGAICSALFHSLRELARTTLEEIAEIRRNQSAKLRVARILEDVEGHAAAIGLPRVVFNFVFVVAVIGWLTAARGKAQPEVLEIIVGVLGSTLVVWVFGLVIPASIARHAGEVSVYAWAPAVRLAYLVTAPLRKLIRFFDEIVRRLAGKGAVNEAEALEEELLSVVEEAQQEGRVDAAEKEMIEAVIDFRSLTVAQVMTPRTEMEAMALTNDLSRVTAHIRKSSHSRIPVYDESLDNIVGVFYVKDLIRWLAGEGSRGGRTFDLKSLTRPALFVPETKTVRELLRELLAKRVHIAIVADEFGGTAGLVTFEDIVEEIVGDIQDEYELAPEQAADVAVNADSRVAEIDARAYIDDVNERLMPMGIEIPESEDYDTVGGFVTVALGRIPVKGETLRQGQLVVTVLDAEPTRVVRVRIEVASEESMGERTDAGAHDDSGTISVRPARDQSPVEG